MLILAHRNGDFVNARVQLLPEFLPFNLKLFKSCPQLTDKLHFHHGLIDCNGGVEILVGQFQHLTATMKMLYFHDHV